MNIENLKRLLHVAIDGDEDGNIPDLIPNEIKTIKWAIERMQFLEKENEQLKNPQVWTNNEEL